VEQLLLFLTGLGPVQHALRTMSGPEGSSIKKVSMCAADPPGPGHPALGQGASMGIRRFFTQRLSCLGH